MRKHGGIPAFCCMKSQLSSSIVCREAMRASVDCDVAGTNAGSGASAGALDCRETAIARTAKVAANARAATRSLVGKPCVRVM